MTDANVEETALVAQQPTKLLPYLKAQGFVKAALIAGPNGKFIAATDANGGTTYLPVGRRSQEGTLAEFNVLITDDGQAIATCNCYKVAEEMAL